MEPSEALGRRAAPVHGWPRAILYRFRRLPGLQPDRTAKITEEGVLFQSTSTEARTCSRPSRRSMCNWRSAATSRWCWTNAPYPATHEEARVSTERTVRWARRCFARHRSVDSGHTSLFPIVQGGMYADLRRLRPELLELDAPGYAIGGLSVGEPRDLSLEMVGIPPRCPSGPPRYAMGVGMPAELPEYVARGIDMMDCVLPSRNARNGYLFTSEGRRHHQARALPGRSASARPRLPVLYLYQVLPSLSSPPVPVRGDAIRGTRYHRTTSGGTLTSCVRLGTLLYRVISRVLQVRSRCIRECRSDAVIVSRHGHV